MRYSFLIIACLCVFAFPELSSAYSSCLISAKTGHAVKFIDESKKTEADIFDKLVSGYHLYVGDNSTIRLCFLNNGRIEEWVGPVTLIINDDGSSDIEHIKVATVSNYEETKTVFTGSDILRNQNKLLSGVTALRGSADNKKLNAAEENDLKKVKEIYVELARKLPKDDYFADFYYIANLERLEQHAALHDHLEKMKEIASKQK